MGETTGRGADRIGALYRDYQDWRVRVYDALGHLSADELDMLGRLLRDDTRQLLDRIEAARMHVAGEGERERPRPL